MRRTPRWRTGYLAFLFAVMAGVLVFNLFYLMLSDWNKTRSDLWVMNRTPVSLTLLRDQSTRLEKMTSDIERHSLQDIKIELEKTTRLANAAIFEMKAQHDSWGHIQKRMQGDAINFSALRQELDDLQALRDTQAETIKKILEQRSALLILAGYLVSFLLGIVSSLVAAGIQKTLVKRRLKAETEK